MPTVTSITRRIGLCGYINGTVLEITPWAKVWNSKRLGILEWVLAFIWAAR